LLAGAFRINPLRLVITRGISTDGIC